MNLTVALTEAESAPPDSALAVLAVEFRVLESSVRRAERERLATWFVEHGDEIRALATDGLSVESVGFLLRMAGE